MDNTRQCQVKGHEMNGVVSICTYKDCQQTNKWVCDVCITESLHGSPNQNHLLKTYQIRNFIENLSTKVIAQNREKIFMISICLQELHQFTKHSQLLIKYLEEDLIKINQNYNKQEIQEIFKQTENDCLKLEIQQINKIVDINENLEKNYEYNIPQGQLKQFINTFKMSTTNLNQIITDLAIKQHQIQMNNQPIKQDPTQYDNHYETYQSDYFLTAQISQNEKYLAMGGLDCFIRVFDLTTKEIIKYIQINRTLHICKFTNNSEQLLCGLSDGYLHCYDITDQCKEIYKIKIHEGNVSNIIIIDENQVLTCDQKTIIITNIQQNKQLLLIQNPHQGALAESLTSIEYDKSHEMIISSSVEKFIMFFSQINGTLQFEQWRAHQNSIHQIQILEESGNLLSSSGSDLILWKIYYNQKQLFKIRLLNQKHSNFSTVLNSKYIVLICEQFVQILDNNLIVVQQINHKINKFMCQILTRQLNSMNYIVVTGDYNLQVLKRMLEIK